ncbi:hypothetical protein FRC00_002969, partial [Tulasnella sp. 408]
MDQSDSTAAPPPRAPATANTLGYHDRYLARTQSMSRTMSLARGNSASGATGQGGGAGAGGGLGGILTPTTRRRPLSHRIGASVGRMEELRQMNTGESESSVSSAGAPMSPTWSRSTVGSAAAAGVMSASSSGLSGTAEGEGSPSSAVSPRVPRYRLWDQPMPPPTSSATQSSSSMGQENGHSSPKAVLSSSPVVHKRHTLPSFFPPPSLPAEPTTTTTPPQRSPSPTRRTAVLSPSALERDAALPPRSPSPPGRTFTSLSRGTTTTPGTVKRLSGLGSPWASEAQQSTSTPTSTSAPPPPERHSISSPIRSRYSSSVDNLVPSLTGSSSASTASSSNTQPAPPTPSSTTISIRSPSPATTPQPTTPSYRSAYMTAKRSGGAYPDSLGAAGGRRKLGRHLPRIASGDGNEDFEEEKRKEEEREEREARERIAARERARQQLEGAKLQRATTVPGLPSIPQSPTEAFDGQEQNDVTGVPNRMRLSRNNPAPKTSATKFTIGLWADVQRHLLQAYEYLCHVGEAQQWIEGCLQEELPFGVVEMDEGLRNGVVLAKLARIWEGEALHPKLQYKHSDNINYFFVFVRRQGLPESFIFELTDLYNKKNIPKVIYCIHALSHLLARKGLAQRIGNLLGQLQFSDDQLMETQKGLTGVSMPNFKGVGRDLAKDMNVEPEPEPEPEETEYERRGRLLAEAEESIIQLQAIARGYLARKAMATAKARLRLAERYIIKLQSRSRGVMTRRVVQEQRKEQLDLEPWALAMQAMARGVLTRRAWRARQARMQYTARYITKIQAQARGVLVRRRFARVKGALRSSRVSITNLQALARAKIGRKKHEQVVKSLEVPIIVSGVVGMQAFARAVLKRREIRKQLAMLDRVEPKIVSLQAHARGVLVRRKVRAQLARLDDATDVIVRIQAACRAWLAKQRLLALIRGLRRSTSGVVQLQAQARAIIAQRKAVALRKQLSAVHVSTGVQGLQSLARAALTRRRVGEVVKRLDATVPDVIPLQALARGILVRDAFWAWRDYLHSAQAEATHLQSLMRGVLQRRRFREKMAFYKTNLSKIVKVQALFRAKEQREQYRQLTMATNVTVGTIKNFVHLLDDSEADFEDEIEVERLRKKVVEGIRENQHLETEVSDLDTKISLLVQNVKSFEELAKARRRHGADTAAAHAARKMPYGMRCIARELLLALRIKFPNEPEEVHAIALGQIIYYRFLNPAIVTPETFDIVPTTVTASARRNLAEISKMLTQITSGAVFGDDNPCLTPLNSYVSEAIAQWTNWLIEVADVPEASVHFHANEFMDATVQPKPIYITPNEVYAMHSVLMSHLDHLVVGQNDTLRQILTELDGVPHLGSDELKDARDRGITLELTNRFAHIQNPHAEENALWVQAKRGVLAILRVQPAKDLVEALLQPVTEEHELLWEDIVDKELVTERMRMRKARMPSTTGRDDTYRLEDIRSLSYQEVKKHAIYFLLELEKRGKITRGDGYQGVLNAIATDVRSKHWKRVQRKEELDGMNEALTHLKERKKFFSEQIDEYNKYVESSMETMQRGKGKKRIVLPFTKQYYHQRELQKAGKAPQFGSFRYSAQELYDKGILLSIDQTSPRQFDKIAVIISSDKAGVFTLEIKDTYLDITKGVTDLKMEELLQAQYEHRTSLSLFDGMAKMDLDKVLAKFVKHGPIDTKPALIVELYNLSTILQNSDADITSLLDALILQVEGLLEAVMTLRNDEAFTFRSRILKVVEKSSRSPHPTLVTCAERLGAFLISLPPWIALDSIVMQEYNALSARPVSSKKADGDEFIQKKEAPTMTSPTKSKRMAQPKSKKKRFVPLSLVSQDGPQQDPDKRPTSPVSKKQPTSPNDSIVRSSTLENFPKQLRDCLG